MENKHTQQVDFSNPNADKIISTSITSIKQETLEERAARYDNIKFPIPYGYIGAANDFINGAKWQQEKMYSEKDMREAFKQGHSSARKGSYNQITEQEDFEKWFEQFKKK
jgi:hypothetical protein